MFNSAFLVNIGCNSIVTVMCFAAAEGEAVSSINLHQPHTLQGLERAAQKVVGSSGLVSKDFCCWSVCSASAGPLRQSSSANLSMRAPRGAFVQGCWALSNAAAPTHAVETVFQTPGRPQQTVVFARISVMTRRAGQVPIARAALCMKLRRLGSKSASHTIES